MSADILATRREGAVLVATINRPDKANALSNEVIAALGELAGAVEASAATPNGPRALVITGAGDRAFSAGADIHDLVGLDGDAARNQMLRGQSVFGRIERLSIVVIAAVNGVALGGGLELAMCADIRIAAPGARFAQPEITLGNLPGWGGTQRLPRLVGRGRATELILTGTSIGAARASEIGLVERIEPDCVSAAIALGAQIGAHSPTAVAAAKSVISVGLDSGMAAGLAAEADAVAACCQTEEQHAAVAAFLAKKATRV